MRHRATRLVRCIPMLALLLPTPAEAQLADPCRVRCALVIGASGFAVGTGTAVVAGRAVGGFASIREGALFWSLGFGVTVGSAIALSGDGGRQERAVYASGAGAVAGALSGWVAATLAGGEAEPTRWAATLVGAAVGAWAGGVYGALTYDAGEHLAPSYDLVFRLPPP